MGYHWPKNILGGERQRAGQSPQAVGAAQAVAHVTAPPTQYRRDTDVIPKGPK